MEYVEARSKFRDAVVSQYPHAQLYTLPVLGQSFTIDVAVFPGNSKTTNNHKTIFHSSGVHGVEGFVGSAIQLALLEKGVLPFLDRGDDDRDDDDDDTDGRPTLVLIHAVNPVGMHQHRRFNEGNVDLNRNCLLDASLAADEAMATEEHGGLESHKQKQYFENFIRNRDPNIANYEDFKSFLSSTDEYPTTFFQYIGLWLRILPKLVQYGYTQLKRSMVSGQYHHSKGIFYGGDELQPSITKLVDFLTKIRPDLLFGPTTNTRGNSIGSDSDSLSSSSSSSSLSSSVVWIDVHSGLGPFGKDSLHCEVGDKRDGNDIKRIFPTAYRVTVDFESAADDDSSAFSGYDLTAGGLTSMLKQIWQARQKDQRQQDKLSKVQDQREALFVVQEFGTLPGILVGRSLILDNMLYHTTSNFNDNNGPNLSYRSPWLRYAFYPQSATWRESVIKRGVALVLDAVNSVST
jgi:hypothetical protein